jgi:hypothetical protein
VGWRNIIEKMHMTATLTKWYDEHGRHEIFAGGKKVNLATSEHKLKLNEQHVNAGAQHDLDDLGIAKNAREEKLRARAAKAKQEAENARMAALYRQHVLNEKPPESNVVPLTSLIASAPATEPAKKDEVAEEVFGD